MANLSRRDPLREMLLWNRSMERMLDQMYGDEGFGDQANIRIPLDVIENDDEFIVKAEIAGIDPENIDITYTDNNLTIKGEVMDEREETEEEGRYHLRERRFGTYSRTISMPGTIDVENIEAESKDGILLLHLPKKEEVKPKRIEVQVGKKNKIIEGKSKDK